MTRGGWAAARGLSQGLIEKEAQSGNLEELAR